MLSPVNRRRSTRNRRNRQPQTPPVPGNSISFSPKVKYRNSRRNANGVLILSKRKRPLPTAEEIAVRKQRKLGVKCKRQSLIALSHKVVALWQYGMNTNQLQFGPGNSAKIIEFLQTTVPQYQRKAAAKSFLYRVLKRHREGAQNPHLDPHRDKRSENARKVKRENPQIVALCDELLSENKATAPKVQAGLVRNGFTVSLSTIYRIAKDLCFKWTWTKPWHTDVLTAAQKLKRKLFCARLLRMTEEQMFRLIADWMFSDEKWFDIVGPASYKYVKARTDKEAKMENQVNEMFLFSYKQFAYYFLILRSGSSQ